MNTVFPVERFSIDGCFQLLDERGVARPSADFLAIASPHVFGIEGFGFYCRLENDGKTLVVLGPQPELVAHLEKRIADPAAVMKKSLEIALRSKRVYFPDANEWGVLAARLNEQ